MDNNRLDLFNDPSVLLIFSCAPAGLGHLRVTSALSHGLPHGGSKILLGSRDKNITFLHRLTSINSWGRKIGLWFQHGSQEKIFTKIYRSFLRNNTSHLYHQLLTLIDSRVEKPEKVIIIATHFSLAHQIAQVKSRLEKERGLKTYLMVQVTDDSPQSIWYVAGADIIFVPSRYTRDVLSNYGKKSRLSPVEIVVNPYPLSPALSQTISKDKLRQRIMQLDPSGVSKTNICLPVSGAAVGLKFYANFIEKLHGLSDRFNFYVISKKASFTEKFLSKLKNKSYVDIYSSTSDREVVKNYDRIYEQNVISLEITKPSEQAFKALLKPGQIGGSILLFTDPVGRQEDDNLHFLSNHGLIPHKEENDIIWESLKVGKDSIDDPVIYNIRNYRGLRLPYGSDESAEFINLCLKKRIFHGMVVNDKVKPVSDEEVREIGSDGVERFWNKVVEYCFKLN